MKKPQDKKLIERASVTIFQFIGFWWGVGTLVLGVYTLNSESVTNWTTFPLIVVGLSLFLKPLKDIPWASLLSLLTAGLITGIFAIYLSPITFLGYDLRLLLTFVFISILVLLYFFLKFIEDLFKIIGIFLSNDPMSFIIGFSSIVLGIGSFFIT